MKKHWAIALLTLLLAFLWVGSAAVAGELEDVQAAIKAKGVKWKAAETSVSKLPPEQRKLRLGLYKEKAKAPEEPVLEAGPPPTGAPATFDWRSYNGLNYVTPVRDQKSCGSCWAFATTGGLESHTLIKNAWPGQDLNLAEQILVSCGGAGSCSGGYIDRASNYIRDTGLPQESCYPYIAQNGTCSTSYTYCVDWPAHTYDIGEWAWVATTAPNVDAIKNALITHGPLVTTMDVYTDFFYYRSDVYQYTSGSYQGGHAILIVGYDDANQCFIVKNSWGGGWGEAGYFRIAYDQLHPNKIDDGITPEGCEFGYWTIAYQQGAPVPTCTYTVSPTTQNVPAAGGGPYKINVGVSGGSDCSWTASTNASWITITPPASGTASGSFNYTVGRNTTGKNRTGTINVAGKTVTVSQKRR